MTFSIDIQVGIPEHIPDMPKMDPISPGAEACARFDRR